MPFARVCGKMRWQFGGNLQPVRMICEFDWKECPSAIINYIWSEIVTDVVDCLTNEWMLWRMIAMLFVCALLVHTIYFKTRLMDETTVNRENLNVVGCKVQDLELKVNILTYKMQYGTWPLPRQIRSTGIESGIRNVRLTLTNSNDRNTWLKHMLLSPSENAEFVPFAKIGPRSVRCLTKLINLETKYMASRFSREASPASNKVKSSSSEKSIKYEKISINSSDSIDNRVEDKLIPKSENLGLRHKDSTKSATKDPNCWSETQVLKYRKHPRALLRSEYYNLTDEPTAKKIERIFAPPKDRENSVQILKYHTKTMSKKSSGGSRKDEEFNTSIGEQVDSTPWSNYREHSKASARQQHFENETTKKITASTRKSEEINGSPEERVQSTHETLHQVKEKLENLHSVLRICGSNASASNTQEEVCSKKELAESILHDLKNLGNLPTESESDGKTGGYVPELLDSNTDDSQCPKEETDSTSEFEQCRSDRDSSSARSYDGSFNIHESQVYKKTNSKNFFENCVSKNNFVSKNDEEEPIICQEKENLSEVQSIPVTEMQSIDSSSDEKTKFIQICEETVRPSSTSSQTELSKESEAEDKTNATLLREALKFKKALLTQMEQENKEKIPVEMEDSHERKSEESDGESDEPQWPNVKNYFQSKLLDIISEEQSASSSTEKTGRTFALAINSMDKEETAENLNEISNENFAISEPVLVAESSEYFSLSNLNEKLVAESTVNVKRNDAIETGDDFAENDQEKEEENLHKNINDLVNQSVQNIREYIEAFSQLQNDAIVETKQAIIDDQPQRLTAQLKECSSEDSIMHFVNTVAKADSICEQLPRKLSEPLINSLLDLESTGSENESPESSDYKPDFSLKRRPGSISLAEQNSNVQSNELSLDNLDSRSLFESAHSETPEEDQREAEVLSSEPSCKELLMDYSLESDSDFTDDKLFSTLNLIEFEEENEPKGKNEWDERARTIDSPLTGRTVIRATSSSASNIQADSTNESIDLNGEFEGNHEPIGIVNCLVSETTQETSQQNVVPETSSTYFTDDVSISEIKENSAVILDDAVDDVSESSTWIIENSPQSMKTNSEVIETRDSAISETPTDSTEMIKTMEKNCLENCNKRPGTGDMIVRKDMDEEKTPNRTGNLSSDTSGTYMDASSRDYLNSSGISLAFDGPVTVKSSKRIEITPPSRSARGSNSSPLRQHIPWNTPKRGLSLNNASTTRSKKPEKYSKPEKLKDTLTSVDNNKNRKTKQTRSQSSSSKHIKSDSQNLSQFCTKDLESSSLTSARRSGKNIKELPERRSRSYVTPRKNEASPRNSVTSQSIDSHRHSRTSKDSDKTKINRDSAKFDKMSAVLNAKESSKSCVTKTSSKSCIPILKSRLESVRQIRAKSPMRGPLTMSMSSWSQEARRTMPATPVENVPGEGNPEIGINEEISGIISPKEPYEKLEKIDQQTDRSTNKIPESRTVIYVNIVTEQEHSATRVVDPKKFLEYLKDRDLKIHSVLDQEIGVETSLPSTAEPGACSSPRILTVVSSAVDGNVSSDRSLAPRSDNSALTGSWSLRVEQREIEVSAKPSVMDTSTSISDLPEISTGTRANLDKFKIFEVPKELTKDEYIVLLEALNQDPNLHQLREMHKLCNKLGLGFHE